jgi:probable rRNA maturation factor
MDVELWRRLAESVLIDEAVTGVLDVTFVDEAAMAALNETHMGHDGPTDVLSFPIDGETRPEASSDGVPRLLGDVVICPAVAAGNAADRGVGEAEELALLVVHGVLHVLGWDHADRDERTAMQARERGHLDRWRTSAPPSGGAAGS